MLAADEDRLDQACLLEISSGLGGGLAYIARTFGVRLAVGLERVLPAVLSSRRRFDLISIQGDGEDLRLPDAAFDIVLNVEASHVYFGKKFLSEVARVLRPGGLFLLTNSRPLQPNETKEWVRRSFVEHGLLLTSFRDISPNVVRACELDGPRREAILKKLPLPFRPALRKFIGCSTSPSYLNLRNHKTTYFIAVGSKAEGRFHTA